MGIIGYIEDESTKNRDLAFDLSCDVCHRVDPRI